MLKTIWKPLKLLISKSSSSHLNFKNELIYSQARRVGITLLVTTNAPNAKGAQYLDNIVKSANSISSFAKSAVKSATCFHKENYFPLNGAEQTTGFQNENNILRTKP